MKRIKFDHKIDWLLLALVLVGLVFYVIGYHWFELQLEHIDLIILIGGYLNVLVLSNVFWYRNYVRWNSKHVFIRINTFRGHGIRFENIECFKFSESELLISKIKSGRRIKISISKIAPEDLDRLESILQKHTLLQKSCFP